MCLAVPMKVVEIDQDSGIVEAGGVCQSTSFVMVPGVQVGDYVIVHAGYAIETLDEAEAMERLKLFRELADSQRGD